MYLFVCGIAAEEVGHGWTLLIKMADITLPYNRKIWRGIKFDGLAVWVETAKLKSTIIFACNTRNDIMHAVAFLAPLSTLLHELYI